MKSRLKSTPGEGDAPGTALPHPGPLGNGVVVVVVVDQLVDHGDRRLVLDQAVAVGQPVAGAVGVVHGEALQQQAPGIAVPGGDAVGGPGAARHLVMPAPPGIGIPAVLPVEDRLALHRQAVPVDQVPVEADQLVGRGQPVVEAQDAAVALVPDVARGPGVGEEDGLGVALAVGLQVGGELDPVVVGHRQLHRGLGQGRPVQAELGEGLQVVLQQQALRSVDHQGAVAQPPARDLRLQAEVAAAVAHAAGVGEDDVVPEDPGAAGAVGRRVVADLDPQLRRHPVLVGREHAPQRVAGPELLPGGRVAQVDVGQPQAAGVEGRVLQAAAQQVGHVGAGSGGGPTRPGEQQGALQAVPRVVEPHAAEAGLAEGQGRELRVQLVARHQPVGLAAAAVRGDDQPLEGVGELGPGDVRALARRLHLLPCVDQPAPAQVLPEGVVPLLPRQRRLQVAQVAVARVVGPGLVPVAAVGRGQGAGAVPLVQGRGRVGGLEPRRQIGRGPRPLGRRRRRTGPGQEQRGRGPPGRAVGRRPGHQ